jgi:putative addiction module component (TIGR02574 family)
MKRRSEVFADALALPKAARLELAAALLESTPPPGALSEDDPGFAEEIRRRVDDLERGDVRAVPWGQARTRIATAVAATRATSRRRRPATRAARTR